MHRPAAQHGVGTHILCTLSCEYARTYHKLRREHARGHGLEETVLRLLVFVVVNRHADLELVRDRHQALPNLGPRIQVLAILLLARRLLPIEVWLERINKVSRRHRQDLLDDAARWPAIRTEDHAPVTQSKDFAVNGCDQVALVVLDRHRLAGQAQQLLLHGEGGHLIGGRRQSIIRPCERGRQEFPEDGEEETGRCLCSHASV